MYIQYKHVNFNELFCTIIDGVHLKYRKRNLGRAQLVETNTEVYKGKPVFRNFKKNTPVIVAWENTPENAWMEISCKHKYIPFDNDQQCVECGHSAKDKK